jgi:hypothetical protein
VIFHVSTTKRKSGGRIITTTIAHAQEAIQEEILKTDRRPDSPPENSSENKKIIEKPNIKLSIKASRSVADCAFAVDS